MSPRRIVVPLAVAACLAAPAAAPAASTVQGAPTFDAPIRLSAANHASVAVGDFDGDGRNDLASIVFSGTVSQWLNTGPPGARFQPTPDRTLASGANGIVAADFDADGFDDVAVTTGPSVAIMKGGPSGLGAPAMFDAIPGAFKVTAGDLDGDGDSDLAVGGQGGTNAAVLVNDGTGTFTTSVVDVGCVGIGIALADVIGDGRTDLAVSCSGVKAVGVVEHTDAGFAPPVSRPACETGTGQNTTFDLDAGDFDGDARPDLLVPCKASRFQVLAGGRGLSPLLGSDDGSGPQPFFNTPTAFFDSTDVGDLNGDSYDDVLLPSVSAQSRFVIAVGDGVGSFRPRSFQLFGAAYTTDSAVSDAVIADVTDDGKPDVVAQVFGELQVFANSTPMPGVRTGAARYLGPSAAVVDATVNASGDNPTTYRFEYGTTRAYGQSTFNAPTGTSITGTSDEPVSAYIDGLAPGTLYHYRVVATNGFGATRGVDKTFVTPTSPPENVSRPAVTGTRAVGEALTCSEGSWEGSPTFAFAWLRNGDEIAGATDARYVATADDAGTALQCQVTGRNPGGTSTAVSAPAVIPSPSAPSTPGGGDTGGGNGGGTTTTPGMDGTITGGGTVSTPNGTGLRVPVFTRMPSIAGNPVVGSVLTCRTGAVTESPRLSIVWRRNGVAIAGATGATYKVVARDVRKAIQCRVSAAGAGGTTVADSNVVTAHLAMCVVPKLTGLTVGMARTALKAASCRLGKVTRAKSRVRSFRVVSSSPGRGKRLAPGSRVAVVLSTGR